VPKWKKKHNQITNPVLLGLDNKQCIYILPQIVIVEFIYTLTQKWFCVSRLLGSLENYLLHGFCYLSLFMSNNLFTKQFVLNVKDPRYK
jgi:hypothetical protein